FPYTTLFRSTAHELALHFSRRPPEVTGGRQGSSWRSKSAVFHPVHFQDGSDGADQTNSWGRSARRRLAQLSCRKEYCCCSKHHQARRSPRAPLASECLRVAVLPCGEGSPDCVYARRIRPHHGLQSKRCRLRSSQCRSLL